MVMFLKDMLEAMFFFFLGIFLKVPKHHFENCGKESFTPIMKTQSLSHLVFTWKKHTFGFMSIKAMLESILPIKIKVD